MAFYPMASVLALVLCAVFPTEVFLPESHFVLMLQFHGTSEFLQYILRFLRLPSYDLGAAVSHVVVSYYCILQGPKPTVPRAVHLVNPLHICIIHSKMRACKSFKSFGLFFPFPLQI